MSIFYKTINYFKFECVTTIESVLDLLYKRYGERFLLNETTGPFDEVRTHD